MLIYVKIIKKKKIFFIRQTDRHKTIVRNLTKHVQKQLPRLIIGIQSYKP